MVDVASSQDDGRQSEGICMCCPGGWVGVVTAVRLRAKMRLRIRTRARE